MERIDIKTNAAAAIALVIACALTALLVGLAALHAAPAYAASTTAGTQTAVTTQAATYSIVFKLNGGKQASGQVTTIAKGKTLKAAKLKAPTRKRYKFAGWYANRALTTKATTLKGVSDASKRTVYAKWTLKSYNIMYNLNGGTFPGSCTKTVGKNKTVKTSALAQPTRKGYSFYGWYTDEGLTKKATKVQGVSDASKRTLYAKWGPVKYVVSYELNGGAFEEAYPTSYKASKGLATLPTPERAGHAFIGWYSDEKLTDHLTAIPANVTGNKLLYARWAERIAVAHRGYTADGAAANSTAAFEAAHHHGYKYVDAEVSFVDGAPVLASTEVVQGQEQGQEPQTQTQTTYVKFADFIQQTCELNDLIPYIELQSDLTRDQVAQLTSIVSNLRRGDYVRWTSSSVDVLKYVQAAFPRASVVLQAPEVTDGTVKAAQELAALGADPSIATDNAHATASAVATCKAAGIPLGIWTIPTSTDLTTYDPYISTFALT